MAAVHQGGELDVPGAAEVVQSVHGRPNRAPRIEHVVDQDDAPSLYVDGDVGGAHDGPDPARHVVPIQADVQGPHRHLLALELADQRRDAMGQRYAAGVDPDEHQRPGATVAFQDLVGDADECASDLAGREYPAGVYATGHRVLLALSTSRHLDIKKNLSPAGKRFGHGFRQGPAGRGG